MEAGKAAPSAGNLQDYRFVVITSKGIRREIAEACLQQYWMETAPVHIIICAVSDQTKKFYGIRGERLYAIQSCAAAMQNMLLTAHNYGLSGCWIGAFEENMIKRAAGIPDSARPQGILTLGYADEKVPTPAHYKLTDIVYLEKYGNKIADIQDYIGYTSDKFVKIFNKGKELAKKIHKKIKGD